MPNGRFMWMNAYIRLGEQPGFGFAVFRQSLPPVATPIAQIRPSKGAAALVASSAFCQNAGDAWFGRPSLWD
jgi:hypothetical protein